MKVTLIAALAAAFIAIYDQGRTPRDWKMKASYHRTQYLLQDSLFIVDGNLWSFVYDKNDKVTESRASDGSRYLFCASGKTDTTKAYDSKGNLVSTEVWLLTGDKPDSAYFLNDDKQRAYRFIYDAEGNRIEQRQYEYGKLNWTTRYQFKNGNCVVEETRLASSIDTIVMVNPVSLKMDTLIQRFENPTTVIYFDFYPNRDNSEGYRKYLREHWADGSNQLKKTGVQRSAAGDTLEIYDYRYTFDDLNRVTSIVSESRVNWSVDSTSYIYY